MRRRASMTESASYVLRGDEAELFRTHHVPLVHAVARSVNASEALIEDACQSAWAVLLRRQPERTPTLFAWLRTVAVHQAYRLSREERRDARLDDLAGECEPRIVGDQRPLEVAFEARRALEALASLPPVQRADLASLVAGFSYREIASLDGRRRSVNNVNKHLTKARARIRRLERAA
jgi:RNA polymerase sigma factor (sigma-70 family)